MKNDYLYTFGNTPAAIKLVEIANERNVSIKKVGGLL